MRLPPLLACLPLLGGCIPYAGPSLAYTPLVRLEAPREEVRAFRVDIASSVYSPGLSGPPLSTSNTQRLREVPVSCRDEVLGQVKASVQYGIVAIGPLTFRYLEGSTLALRLYRPGYELVEISAWEATNRVEWKRLSAMTVNEAALNALFGGNLEPGGASKAHRAALLFGASEYDRLAGSSSSTDGELLRGKAENLRDLAAQ